MNLLMYNHCMVRLVGAEGAEKKIEVSTLDDEVFASFSQVSERKNERNECAEDAHGPLDLSMYSRCYIRYGTWTLFCVGGQFTLECL